MKNIFVKPFLVIAAAVGIVVTLSIYNSRMAKEAQTKSSRALLSSSETGDLSKLVSKSTVTVVPIGESQHTKAQTIQEGLKFSQSSPRLEIGKSSARDLIASQDAILVDYALNRLSVICGLLLNQNAALNLAAQQVDPLPTRAGVPLNLTSSSAQRVDAAMAAHSKCRNSVGSGLSDNERLSARNGAPELDSILKEWATARKKYGSNFLGVEENSKLAEKILGGPYFGLLGLARLEMQDFELANIAGVANVAPLKELALDFLLMCRLGENCSQGSLASNRLCAEVGLCGTKNVEDTLLAYFQNSGLDWTLFENYLQRIQRAVNTKDSTIFKRKILKP